MWSHATETMTTTTTMRRINFLNRTMDLKERASCSFMTMDRGNLGSGITRNRIGCTMNICRISWKMPRRWRSKNSKSSSNNNLLGRRKMEKMPIKTSFKGYTTFSTKPDHPGLFILQAQSSWAFPSWECQVPETLPQWFGRRDIP